MVDATTVEVNIVFAGPTAPADVVWLLNQMLTRQTSGREIHIVRKDA